MVVNVQEIIARIGTGFTAIEKRVLKVIPGWKLWPRRLRKGVYFAWHIWIN